MSDLIFPSGLSVKRARTRAKELVKTNQYDNLSKALDSIALKEMKLPWAIATHQLHLNHKLHSTPNYLITVADIERIMKSEPFLTYEGFVSFAYEDSFYLNHDKYSKSDDPQRYKKNREYLRASIDECQKCCIYLQYLNKLKTVRYKLGSYGLKHSVEQYHFHRGLSHDDAYVSNGAFICSAIHMGFKVIRKNPLSLNAWICASVNSDILLWERFSQDWYIMSAREKRHLEQIKQRIGLL